MPPNRITNDKVQNFLARNTVPLSLSNLPAGQTSCPICRNTYAEVDRHYVPPLMDPDVPEWAVQVVRCGDCNHIVGRRCIERCIRAGEPWSHMCPMCRHEWFVPPHSTRTDIIARLRMALTVLAYTQRDTTELQAALDHVEELLREIENSLLDRRYI
ncbi:hypothetical protein K491DRAFT_259378 [Lophiostoma macrostomum CBS 122681]|uniref:RING-type domain-containing protein n=1 Tax=Lophiostoma macrostomum CBS 122681 TaxID=1314788 RepID=A0A6A6THY7_9PLEO|nr:hypothetical protein K491DRAFT_259378 [Lophiostoma macrostomum CBS 122681]